MDIIIGAPIIDMEDEENKDKYMIIDMGVNGAQELKNKYKENTICIYIIPPNKERLISQMNGRAQSRLARNERQIIQAKKVCNWLVINDELDETVENIEKLMRTLRKFADKKIAEIDIDTMKFLWQKNLKFKGNSIFLDDFYTKEIRTTTEIGL